MLCQEPASGLSPMITNDQTSLPQGRMQDLPQPDRETVRGEPAGRDPGSQHMGLIRRRRGLLPKPTFWCCSCAMFRNSLRSWRYHLPPCGGRDDLDVTLQAPARMKKKAYRTLVLLAARLLKFLSKGTSNHCGQARRLRRPLPVIAKHHSRPRQRLDLYFKL